MMLNGSAGIDRHRPGPRALLGHPARQRLARIAFVIGDPGQAGRQFDAGELRRHRAIEEQVARAAIGDHRRDRLRRGGRGERGGGRPDPHRRDEGERIADRVGARDRHRVATPDPLGLQPRRNPIDAIVKAPPVEPLALVDDRLVVRAFGRVGAHEVGEGHEILSEHLGGQHLAWSSG